MIRKWINAKRNKNIRARKPESAKRNRYEFGQFENLEDRLCLAFVGFFDGITLTLEQTFDDGDVVVDNSGIGTAWRVTDNSGTLSFVRSENLVVDMLDNTANQINLNANVQHNGSVTLNLGHGPRDIAFTGMNIPILGPNVFTGDVTVNAGDSVQNVLWSPVIGNPINVMGNMSLDLGTGFDTMFNSENFATVGGDLTMVGVNDFRFTDFLFPVPLDAFMTVGGNFSMDTSNESVESFYFDLGTFHEADLDPALEERTIVGGNFTYIGGDDIDHVDLNNIHIKGDLDIDLGPGIPFFGDPQNVTSTFVFPRVLNGEGGGPYFELNGDSIIAAGDANLDNIINVAGYHDGNTAEFIMGDLVDDITYSWRGRQVDVTATMGGGDDTFTLNQHLNLLNIDFGNDSGDVFVNNIGKFSFDADFTNFHWFDHTYTVGDDTLALTQLINTGDVTVDNVGGISGVAWRVLTPLGGVAATTPANNLVLNMLDNTGNDVFMDLDNPVLAFLTLNLGNGDRNVNFIGDSNNPLRDIIINGNLGDQHVEISVNAPLAVATLSINLGVGFDTVDDDANNLLLGEDLIFSGVNLFENDGILSVGRNLIIDTSGESEDNIFASNVLLVVAGRLTYTGGNSRDEIRLNGSSGTSIGGNVNIDLGDNLFGGTQMVLFDQPGVVVGGNLAVVSSADVSPDLFRGHPTARFNGNVSVDLGGGPNVADLLGILGGSTVTYLGGGGVDVVTFGLTGGPALLTIVLGGGDDIFTLGAGTTVVTPLTIDFGGGVDTFNNNYGVWDFNADLTNLNGFDHSYNLLTNTLVSTQVSDPGPVTVDNNGPGNGIRFTTGATTSSLTPVTDLTIDMLNESGTDLTVALGNAFAGDLSIDLAGGNRGLMFTGANNSIGGNLEILAGAGDQTVDLSVNNGLTVTGNANVELGEGLDIVDEAANSISVIGDLTMLGVNQFINNGAMTVGGGLVFDASGEEQVSRFENVMSMTVTGDFSYSGGNSADNVLLDGVLTTIGGNTSISVGDNITGGTQLISLDSAATSIGGTLNVNSIAGINPDVFVSNPATIFGNNIDISLGGGANTADIFGVFGGSQITYAGGSGVDLVTVGTTGTPANITATLGGGDDTFTLEAGTSLGLNLSIDFGDNNDTFVNNFGQFNFNADLLGLNGFDHSYSLPTDTLTSTQISDQGAVTVDDNGAANAIRFTAGGTTGEVTPVSNLFINMLDESMSELNIDFDAAFAGDLALNLGTGDRNVNFTGSSNTFNGNLAVTAGDGGQVVEVAVNNALTVNGDASFDLGAGNDIVDEDGNNVSITGDLDLVGVNMFRNDGTMNIGGNVVFDTTAENQASQLDDNASLTITGDLTYNGGEGRDRVTLDGAGGSNVGGNAFIDLGDNTATGTQVVSIGNGSSIGGSLTVKSTGSVNSDSFTSDAGSTLGGDIDINLGAGANSAVIDGTMGGSSVKYNGGGGTDNVLFGMSGNPSFANIKLGAGNDQFVLDPDAALDTTGLRVDFGGGVDVFTNNYGTFDFDAKLLNWNGFSRFYIASTDTLNMVQVSDTGDVTLDNNGPDDALRLTTGTTTTMTPATHARLIMLDNSSQNVIVDFNAVHDGDLIVQLRSGDRDLYFTGFSNTFGGLLRVEAADGVQNVHLAVSSDLHALGSLVINGRDGVDSIDDGFNDINVGNAMILRGVNLFNNDNTMTVGGDFNMITLLETEDTRLGNSGTINIGGNITYLAGDGVDRVVFNGGGVSVGGYTYLDLAGGNDLLKMQRIVLNGGFSTTSLQVNGGSSLGGYEFLTDSSTNIAGFVIVDFTGSNAANSVRFLGTYGGTYGTFRSGEGADTLIFGAAGTNMDFVVRMGGGNDLGTLESSSSMNSLFLDFGAGSDTLVDNLGLPAAFVTVANL